MKKALVRRVVSLFLCFCMVIGFVPIIDAQAAEIKGGTFDPHTGYLELEFGYQLTQYVNINVYVRSPSDDGLKKEFVGSIVEITCSPVQTMLKHGFPKIHRTLWYRPTHRQPKRTAVW
mgnify:CR=1 FL=1